MMENIDVGNIAFSFAMHDDDFCTLLLLRMIYCCRLPSTKFFWRHRLPFCQVDCICAICLNVFW